jgi:hypothetical protein
VEYGTSTSYGASAGLDTDFSLTDEANLTGLIPNTTYHYRIRSSDQVGNVAHSNDNTFTTGALPMITPETNPPVISEIATTSVSSVAATIAWTTNELAVSTMSYGTTLNYDRASRTQRNAHESFGQHYLLLLHPRDRRLGERRVILRKYICNFCIGGDHKL